MINHSPFVAPSPSLALVRREAPARAAATLCALAFDDCAPRLVARGVHRSEDLVRRWGRGEGSPSLVQLLQAPERFGRRLAADLGALYAPAVEVGEVPPRERLWLASKALGRLLATTPQTLDSLDQLSDDELRQQLRDWQTFVDESERGRDAVARVLREREAQRQQDKGVR